MEKVKSKKRTKRAFDWEHEERLADEDIKKGCVNRFSNVQQAIQWLNLDIDIHDEEAYYQQFYEHARRHGVSTMAGEDVDNILKNLRARKKKNKGRAA